MQPISRNQAGQMYIGAHNQLVKAALDNPSQLPASTRFERAEGSETLTLNDPLRVGDKTFLPGTRISSWGASARQEEIKYKEDSGQQVEIQHDSTRFLGIYRNDSLALAVSQGLDSTGFRESSSEIGFPVGQGWILKTGSAEEWLLAANGFNR